MHCKISLLKCGQIITKTHQYFLAAAQRSLGCHFAPHLHYDVAQLLLIWRLYMDSLPDMPTSLALCKSNLNIVSVAASYSIYSYWKIKWHKPHFNEMFVCLFEWMPSIFSCLKIYIFLSVSASLLIKQITKSYISTNSTISICAI